jgi:hypothetical protein
MSPSVTRSGTAEQRLSVEELTKLLEGPQADARGRLIVELGTEPLVQHPRRERTAGPVRQIDDDLVRTPPAGAANHMNLAPAQWVMPVPDAMRRSMSSV